MGGSGWGQKSDELREEMGLDGEPSWTHHLKGSPGLLSGDQTGGGARQHQGDG